MGTAALAWFTQTKPVYWSEATVAFIAPRSDNSVNDLTDAPSSLIHVAGVVQRDIDNGDPYMHTASQSVTLLDKGDYDGRQIVLPDTGGQWSHNFEQAALDVQVSGRDPHDVSRRMAETLVLIDSTLAYRQQTAGVRSQNFITTRVNPQSPVIVAESGQHGRALIMSLLLGLASSLSIVCLADHCRKFRKGNEWKQLNGS
jgi:hypothetical protein